MIDGMEVSEPCQAMQAMSAPAFDSPTLMHLHALQEELLRTLGMQGAGFNGTTGSDFRTLVLSSPFTKLSHHLGRLAFPYSETDIIILSPSFGVSSVSATFWHKSKSCPLSKSGIPLYL